MAWWRRSNDAEEVAREYAKALFEALRDAAQTKAVPPRGMLQMLGTLQAKLAATKAPTIAPVATMNLVRTLAELMTLLNAGVAEYEQSFLGQFEARIQAGTQPAAEE